MQAVDTAEQATRGASGVHRPVAGRRPARRAAGGGRATVLTVGDTDGFARDGVAINLYTFDNRVRIEVNSAAAARAGLQLSANLMRLARVVE